MRRRSTSLSISTLILLVTVPLGVVAAPRRLDMNFEGQMKSAVDEIREKMTADPDLKGRKLRLDKFTSRGVPDSNFEQEFERQFEELAGSLLSDDSEFFVRGSYQFIPGTLTENEDLRVVQLLFEITGPGDRKLQTIRREVNDTGDISRILGLSVAPPDTKDIDERNAKAEEAFNDPQFSLRGETQVTAVGNNDYAVEIRRHAGGTEPAKAIVPDSKRGQAFVDLSVKDTFEIALFNYDSQTDAVARVTIDGLDVVNEFCTDESDYSGYVTPRAQGAVPGSHVIPGWLRTSQHVDDNVFRFVVNELGKGAATARNSRGRRGVITVQFFEAVPPSEELPSRSFGEVGTGEPMTVEYDVKEMKLRETPIVTISIRYSNHPSE